MKLSVTIGFSIATCAMIVAPGLPPVYHAIMAIPNLALESSMACRVFRHVKLGFVKDVQYTSSSGTGSTTVRFGRVQLDLNTVNDGTSMAQSRNLPIDLAAATDAAESMHSRRDEKRASRANESTIGSDQV